MESPTPEGKAPETPPRRRHERRTDYPNLEPGPKFTLSTDADPDRATWPEWTRTRRDGVGPSSKGGD